MKREHILDFVYNEFTSLGIKGVSIDGVAASLRISKKTIYEMFSNKEKLLQASLEHKFGKLVVAFSQPQEEQIPVLCHIIRSSVQLFKIMNRISQNFFDEIKSYPEAVEYMKSVTASLKEMGRVRFIQCVEEGYLMEEVDFEIVGKMLHLYVMKMRDEDGGKYTPARMCYRALIIILRGVCTDKGRVLLDSLHDKEIEEIG